MEVDTTAIAGIDFHSPLSGGLIFITLYLIYLMKVITTLVKKFHTGTVSVWSFFLTDEGKFVAYSNNGKRYNFPTLEKCEKAIANYRGYDYTSQAATLVKQLSLI